MARPPLYHARVRGRDHALVDEAARVEFQHRHPKAQIQRFKGLGEMTAEQLRKSAMDPESRVLFQVEIGDEDGADRLFQALMGEDVKARKKLVQAEFESGSGTD